MWDSAALLRNIANTMLAFSAIAVLYGAVYFVMRLPEVSPLRSVRLTAALQQVAMEQLLQVLRTEVQGNFITMDIDRLRLSLEKLPWVRSVNIRREFPNRLAVQLEEHQVLARWNESALVNHQGEVFVAESDQILPSFIGPEGDSTVVTHHYTQFGLQLAELDLHAVQIVLSPRHAWKMRLNNGVELKLGREDMQQRLARFVAAYPYSLKVEDQKQTSEGRLAYVDLRYRNGFAVKRIANGRG
ncbi:MAG: cell division protein FtsQ/DivIB [Gallionella sp.]